MKHGHGNVERVPKGFTSAPRFLVQISHRHLATNLNLRYAQTGEILLILFNSP